MKLNSLEMKELEKSLYLAKMSTVIMTKVKNKLKRQACISTLKALMSFINYEMDTVQGLQNYLTKFQI